MIIACAILAVCRYAKESAQREKIKWTRETLSTQTARILYVYDATMKKSSMCHANTRELNRLIE